MKTKPRRNHNQGNCCGHSSGREKRLFLLGHTNSFFRPNNLAFIGVRATFD